MKGHFSGRFVLPAVIAAVALAAAPAASAAPGDLDPSFGSGGVVRMLPSQEKIAVRDVAVQADDKIVFAGVGESGNLLVGRLLTDGSLDPSFGTGGLVTAAVLGQGWAIAVQPDGKIVVAGEAFGTTSDFLVARFNTDGSPDAGFGGGDGIVTQSIGSLDDRAEAVAIGPDGKIVAMGYSNLPASKHAMGVLVLLPNGTPDPGFGTAGVKAIATPGSEELDEGVAASVLGDGRILLGDSSASGGGKGIELVQLLTNGSFDPSFGGGDGIVVTPIPVGGTATSAGRVTHLLRLADGTIVASGTGYDEPTPGSPDGKFVAAEYQPNGELVGGFGSGGIFAVQAAPGIDEQAKDVELADNGRLLLVGEYFPPPSGNSPALARLTSSGALDPAFGVGGVVLRGQTAPFGELMEGAAVDSYGRLVTVGKTFDGGGHTTVTVTRYLGDRLPPVAAPPRTDLAPHARMKKVPRRVAQGKLKGFSGTASDPDGSGVRSVQLALVRAGAKHRCFALGPKGDFKRVKAKGKACPQRWLAVKGTAKWKFRLRAGLRPGRYIVYARAIDGQGLAESSFSRKLGNRYAFRVLAAR